MQPDVDDRQRSGRRDPGDRARLRDLETQANAIEIFGQRPVAPLGQLFGQIATDVSGLDEQLDGIATEMGRNQAALTANAKSLGALADLVRAYKGRLKPEAIDAGHRGRPASAAADVGALHRLDGRPCGRLAHRGSLDAPVGRCRAEGVRAQPKRQPGAAVEPDPLPEEPLRGRVPREEDQDLERDRQAARRRAGPRAEVRPGQRRDLEDALRPDDDLASARTRCPGTRANSSA